MLRHCYQSIAPVLGNSLVIVLLCHSCGCGCFEAHSMLCSQGHLLCCTGGGQRGVKHSLLLVACVGGLTFLMSVVAFGGFLL